MFNEFYCQGKKMTLLNISIINNYPLNYLLHCSNSMDFFILSLLDGNLFSNKIMPSIPYLHFEWSQLLQNGVRF